MALTPWRRSATPGRGVPLENREVDVSDFENFEFFLIVTDSKEVKLGWMAVVSSLVQRCIPELVTLRFAAFFNTKATLAHSTKQPILLGGPRTMAPL